MAALYCCADSIPSPITFRTSGKHRVELASGTTQTPDLVRRSRSTRGLTLVEVALLLSLLGVVLAVGVPAFVRGLRTSKTAEAPDELQRMFASVAAYYGSAQPTAAGKRVHCLPEAAGPTPEQPSADPVEVQFTAPEAPGSATWRALGYTPAGAIRYRYSLLPEKPGCGVTPHDARDQTVLTLRAEGDLDADGVLSRFERTVTARDGELVLEPLLVVHERVE
jgi:Tfp pilus assembly protein PilE